MLRYLQVKEFKESLICDSQNKISLLFTLNYSLSSTQFKQTSKKAENFIAVKINLASMKAQDSITIRTSGFENYGSVTR